MVITKKADEILRKLDFMDSIVIGIRWDSNLLDLIVEVDYFWSEKESDKELTIRFKNCVEAKFTVPERFANDLNEDIFSPYTITDVSVKQSADMVEVSIRTVEDEPRWLQVKCREVWVEEKV